MRKITSFIKWQLLFAFFYINAFSQQGRWDSLITNNHVNGRSECGMAASNGKLYLIGGEGINPVEEFNPITMSWTKKSPPPVEMNHFEAVSFENKIYVLEAFEGGSYPNQTNLSNVYIYNTLTDTWEKGSGLDPERRRAAAGAAEYEGKLYLVNGIQHGHTSGTTNMFDVYDPVTDKWSSLPGAPHIRDHCEAAVAGDKLYVVGGRNTSYRDPNKIINYYSQTVLEVDCYDFQSGKWTTLSAKLPLGTGGGALVNLNGILYYMGGERATSTEHNAPRKNTYYLNPDYPNKWIETDSLNLSRNGMCAAILNNKIYAFGGAGSGGPPPVIPMNQLNDNVNMRPPPGPPSHPGPSPLEIYTLSIDLVELL